jgi:CBS domain-containing protein
MRAPTDMPECLATSTPGAEIASADVTAVAMVMQRNVVSVRPDLPLDELAHLFLRHDQRCAW